MARSQLLGMVGFLQDKERYLQALNTRIAEVGTQLGKTDKQILFTTVGQALTTWARMEEGLILIASILFGGDTDKTGLVFYSILNFQVWLNIIDELFSLDPLYAPLKPKWNKIGAQLRALKDDRDRLAHHPIDLEEDGVFKAALVRPSKFDMRKKSKKYLPLNSEEVGAFSATVIRLADDIIDLSKAMIAQHAASQQKSS